MHGFSFLEFIIYLTIVFGFWYMGVVILRWVLGTQKMIIELRKQNETLIEILIELKKSIGKKYD